MQSRCLGWKKGRSLSFCLLTGLYFCGDVFRGLYEFHCCRVWLGECIGGYSSKKRFVRGETLRREKDVRDFFKRNTWIPYNSKSANSWTDTSNLILKHNYLFVVQHERGDNFGAWHYSPEGRYPIRLLGRINFFGFLCCLVSDRALAWFGWWKLVSSTLWQKGAFYIAGWDRLRPTCSLACFSHYKASFAPTGYYFQECCHFHDLRWRWQLNHPSGIISHMLRLEICRK